MAKITRPILRIMWLLSPFALIYGTMLVISASVGLLHGQPNNELRIEKLESESINTRIDIDHRLTILETTLHDLQDSSIWFRVSTGGTGLLIVKAAVELLTLKKSKETSDEE